MTQQQVCRPEGLVLPGAFGVYLDDPAGADPGRLMGSGACLTRSDQVMVRPWFFP